MSKKIRVVNGLQKIDKRKFYTFKTMEGQLVETKAVTEQEALDHIRKHIKLKEAA